MFLRPDFLGFCFAVWQSVAHIIDLNSRVFNASFPVAMLAPRLLLAKKEALCFTK